MLNRDLLKNWIDKTKRAGAVGVGVEMAMVVVYAPLSTYAAHKVLRPGTSGFLNHLTTYKPFSPCHRYHRLWRDTARFFLTEIQFFYHHFNPTGQPRSDLMVIVSESQLHHKPQRDDTMSLRWCSALPLFAKVKY